MKVPKNIKDVQTFVGMVGYYRQFIQDFSKIACPLFQLLKGPKDKKEPKPFLWNDEAQVAFDALRKYLISEPILAYTDFKKHSLLSRLMLH